MKNIIKISLVFLLTISTLSVFAEKKERGVGKSVPSFMITERSIDKTLKKGEAKFEFNFKNENGIHSGSIQIGMNDTVIYKTTSISGIITEKAKSGYYKLYFYVNGYYEVIEDSVKINSQEVVKAEIRFSSADPNIIITVDKPVIYVYPNEKMDINIQLNTTGKLNFTYPAYNEGWNFTAAPDGNITMNGKQYNYLFWESQMPESSLEKNDVTGFLVETENLPSFLEKSLSQMGLNSKEQADFITYWYPRMMVNEKNHIHFIFNEACDSYAELKITPQPDNIFRVGMVWANATNNFVPEIQEIQSLNRNGYTVIEWGGTEVSTLFNSEK